jgi:hypothetical protein
MNTRTLIASNGTPLLFNRDAAGKDGWVHIVPKGELENKEANVVQVLDDRAHDSIIANLRADAEKLGNRWPGLYGGEEHFIYDKDKSSAAFMWAKEFEKREDGVWARGDVTDVGEPAIKNKRFKYTSFVTDPEVPGSIEKLDGNRVRILRIDTFGFTNYANGRHLLTPITNRDETTLPASPATPHAGEQAAIQNRKAHTMKQIATRLGLAAEASEDAILGELTKLFNRAEKAELKIQNLETELSPLKNRVAEFDGEEVTGLLDEHKVTDEKTRSRLTPLLKPLKNRAERESLLLDLGFKKSEESFQAGSQRQLRNREGKAPQIQTPGDKSADQLNAQKIMNRAKELREQFPHMSLATAATYAQREIGA